MIGVTGPPGADDVGRTGVCGGALHRQLLRWKYHDKILVLLTSTGCLTSTGGGIGMVLI